MPYPIVLTGAQQQSDYSATDSSSPSFILNKPGILALDVQNRNASVTLPTTPVVVTPQIVAVSSGITYDPATGIITLPETRVYSTFTLMNVSTTNNRTIYTYAEVNLGAGWIISQYSGREIQVTSQTDGQVTTVSRNLFPAGAQLRFPLYCSGTNVTLVSANLPGTTPGTVISPAYRLLIAA
jgi:hypothetical protein